jgi:FMN phosphatase YigB (HAD superfamily)
MITTILFDLGNVLLHFNHRLIEERLRPFAAKEDPERGARRCKELAADFERGQIDSDGFINTCISMMQAAGPIDRQVFMDMWNDIFWINEPLAALLPELGRRVRLVLLSNTNPLHIAFVRARFPGLLEIFPLHVLSYETRLMKPDTRIYEEALQRAEARPAECLFFDDIRTHVTAAASIGIHAYQYVSVEGVRDILAVFEVLPPRPDHA